MSTFKRFIFEDYSFDESTKALTLSYSFDDSLAFKEEYVFNFDFVNYDSSALESAFDSLFFMAGVSYFKSYQADEIVIRKGTMTADQAEFYSKTYQKGLGEFFYKNNLNPQTKISFPINSEGLASSNPQSSGFLLAIGGGKDSLVSHDILTKTFGPSIETWSLNHELQLTPLIDAIGSQHNFVSRKIDEKLLTPELLPAGKLSGHVPISAIFACVGVVVALLRGKRDVVMSNERSADEATLTYNGTAINHQYSKTSEFEADFQNHLKNLHGDSVRYYSLLRPLSEVQIAKYFIENGFNRYNAVFSSCNKAYVHGQEKLFWDAKCSKCAFIYLIFQPFLDEVELTKLFGHNLLLDPELETTYQQLLGLTEEKPLECIGEIAESRWAMQIAKAKHADLDKYSFETIKDDEIFKISTNLLPTDIATKVNYAKYFALPK